MRTRSLSGRESQVILSLEARDEEEVTIDDIQSLTGVSRTYARKLAHDLAKKHWLDRIGRGRYLLVPPENGPDAIPELDPYRVGSHLVDPYAFAYGTAASLHGLLTHALKTYHIATPTTTRVSVSEPVEYNLVHVSPERFFGTADLEKYGTQITVTDLERTVLDCLDRPDLCGGIANTVQIIHHAKPKLDHARLLEYVDRFSNKSLAQRLGYLLARVRPSTPAPPEFLQAVQERLGQSHVPLAPATRHGHRGPRDGTWRIIQNLPDSELYGEVPLR